MVSRRHGRIKPCFLLQRTMANEQNLKPFTSEQSREEAVKNGRKGGIRSGEAKRERRLLKDAILERMGADDWDARVDGLIDRAKGSDKAFEVLRDTIGQKPIDKVAVSNIDQSLGELYEYFGRQEKPNDTPATE